MKNDSKTCLCEVIPMHLILTAADKSDVGKQREQNEDCAYKRIESSEEGDRGLFIVADGMGGYQAGEVASRLAVETIGKAMDSFFKPLPDQTTIRLTTSSNPLDPDATIKLTPRGEGVNGEESPTVQKTRKLPETLVSKSIEDQLTAAIQQANKAILRYGDLKPITKDHSLVARLVEAKQIEPDDVYSHPQRNLIYRSLGAGHKTVEVDVFHETLHPGDILLLCSDGLWEMVRREDLLRTLSD